MNTPFFLCVCSVQRTAERTSAFSQHRYCVASLILLANIAEITAQELSLSCLILCVLLDFMRRRLNYKFGFLCRLTSWKG